MPLRLAQHLSGARTYLNRLQDLYADMVKTYTAVAREYDFDCSGCRDNCCRTRFYNHTYIEYFYLQEGLAQFSEEKQAAISQKAAEACRQVAAAEKEGQTPRVMCPLNEDGWCGLYDHRLMICRLHGLAYELHYPGRAPYYGEGCQRFSAHCGQTPYVTFDRTPFYQRLAALEKDLRARLGATRKIKMTIAQMIVDAPPPWDAPREDSGEWTGYENR